MLQCQNELPATYDAQSCGDVGASPSHGQLMGAESMSRRRFPRPAALPGPMEQMLEFMLLCAVATCDVAEQRAWHGHGNSRSLCATSACKAAFIVLLTRSVMCIVD